MSEWCILNSEYRWSVISLAFAMFYAVSTLPPATVQSSLDSSFGSDGIVVADFGGSDRGLAVAIQSDGLIVVAGRAYSDGSGNFGIARFESDGRMDTRFGTDGLVVTDFEGQDDIGNALAIQSDGRIVVAGTTGPSSYRNIAVAVYGADGNLAVSFDADGKIETDFGGYEQGLAVATQPDGKIVVAGYAAGSGFSDVAVVRYSTDGSLDTSFDLDGVAFTDAGGFDRGHAVSIQSDGKIVVAGRSVDYDDDSSRFLVIRYNGDGSLDPSFGGVGVVHTDVQEEFWDEGTDVSVQADGKIVVVGESSVSRGDPPFAEDDFVIVRYRKDGTLDTDFGGGVGGVLTDFGGSGDYARSVATLSDGTIVVAGVSLDVDTGDSHFAVARYDDAGRPDRSFGPGGRISTDIAGEDFGEGVAIQSDGRVILAGTTDGNTRPERSDFALVRYEARSDIAEVYLPTLSMR